MSAHLNLLLLGGFQFFADNRLVPGLNSSRLQSLLAYLAMHRDAPQPRQRLAFLLWPDSTEEQARANLRNLVFLIRRAWPSSDLLLSRDGALQWNPEEVLSLDTAKFEAAVNAGEFERAINSYKDDLLPCCFDEWILVERERLKQMYVAALEGLAEQEEAAGDYSDALRRTLRLLQVDPLREETHRRVMRLHALSGDRAAVLHAYQNCATQLQQELGVEPSLTTRQLYERLMNCSEPELKHPALSSSLPLIGRASEWSELVHLWRAAAGGRPQMVIIKGEAGIGKTRLAEELSVWVSRQGIACATAHCYEVEGALAYAPVAAWLRARPLSGLAPVWQAEIRRLVPELGTADPAATRSGLLTEAWQRQRFHEAMVHAILEPDLGRALPLLLTIEDLQWCDADSLEWLHYLLHFNERVPFLVLATLREDALQEGCLLSSLITDLRRRNLLTEIELKPLSPEETGLLGQHATGHVLDAGTSQALFAVTEGNPLFVIEFARASLTGPAEIDSDESARVLPPRVQAAVIARLTQLTPSARKIMEVAATIGRDFTYDVLAKASGESADTLVQALDELWQRRVIRERGQAGYDFSHALLRQVVYAKISQTRRRWLHQRVACGLAEVYATHPETVSGQIGWHFERAGEAREAAQWLLQDGEAAMKVGAFSKAVAYLTHALELAPETDREERFTLLLRREKVYHLQSKREAQARDLSELAKMAGAMEDSQPDGAFRAAQVALERGSYLCETSELPGAIDAAQEALTWIDRAKERSKKEKQPGTKKVERLMSFSQLEFEANYLWGTALGYQGKFPEAIVQEEKALKLARTAGMRREEARALYGITLNYDDVSTGKDYLAAALPIYREVGDKPGECTCLETLGYTYLWIGDYDEALNCYEQSLQLARQIGFRGGELIVLFRLGHFYNQVGNYLQGKDYLERALSMARSDQDQRRVAYVWGSLSISERGLGQLAEAEKHACQALAICQEIGDHNGENNAWLILGGAYEASEQWNQAAAAFQKALDLICHTIDPGGTIYAQAKLAGVLLRQGKIDQAVELIERVLAYREAGGDLQGTDEGPIPVNMECYKVLLANGDPRAGSLLQETYILMQQQASRIKDSALRQSFLENKRENRELVEAYQ